MANPAGRRATGGIAVVGAIVVAILVPLLTTEARASDVPARWQQAPLASWRVEGTGNATVVVGNTVYVGGEFSTVRSPDGRTVATRSNLAAFDLATGALKPDFQANTNGVVRSLVASGGHLVVGGSFTSVRGLPRSRLAAVDLTTGAVSTTLVADTNSNVYSLALAGGRLYVGGSYSTIRGVSRSRLAALDASTWAVTSYAPNPNGTVLAVATSRTGDRVYAGGTFSAIGGVPNPWLVRTDAAGTRLATPWTDLQGPPLDLEVSDDGSQLAVAQAGGGNQGTLYDSSTGARRWRQRCDGDAQAVHLVDGTMVTGFHEACDGDVSQRLTSNDRSDGARDQAFRPTFDRFWGVFGIAGDAQHLVIAGDFTTISGVAVQGFAIFTRRAVVAAPVQLSAAATWRYLVTPTTPAAGWNQPGYADGAWPSGRAQLGYGEDDEATVVGFGPNPDAKYLTTYFRTTFQALAVPQTLTVDLLADDGAAVFVNGVEVVRDNLPAGPLAATTRAREGRSGAAEGTVRAFAIPPSAVHAGTNTIAVEVHQDDGGSSDLSFAVALTSTGSIPTTTTTTTRPPTTTTTTTRPPATTTTTTRPPATTTTTTVPPAPGTALYASSFPGANGSPWSGWTSGAASGTVSIQSAAGQLRITDVAGAYARAQLTALAPRANAQVRFSYRWWATGPTAYLNVYARGSDGWANAYRPRQGYGLELSSSSREVAVRRVSGGTVSTLRTVAAGQALSTQKQWLALRVVGTTIQFKSWVDGSPEPAAWTATTTDAGVTAPGQLFISVVRGGGNTGAKSVVVDDLRITAG